MKTMQFIKDYFLFIAIMTCSVTSFAQQGKIQGKVTDDKGVGLPGSTVVIEADNKSTVTDINGDFTIGSLNDGTYKINISYIGFTTQKTTVKVPQSTKLNITLKEDQSALDEVVVTGVFDKRTKLGASVAISTINAKTLNRLAPVSAADMLKTIPGVYVNSAYGEVKNVIYSRGVSANSVGGLANDPNGYYYVSLQEDGLPVAAVNSASLSADYFFRSDATIYRVEAVRGGTSSITSANAPGGVFNFLSKTGSGAKANEFRQKIGLEGDGKNLYTRSDINIGNTFGKYKKWSYNIGGFYRYSDGARYAGYAQNKGGQIKANVMKSYNGGSIKFYAKYLDDHNGSNVPLIGKGFGNDITLADGVKKTDSYALTPTKVTIPNRSDSKTTVFDPTNLNHSKDAYLGIDWQQKIGDSWVINNNIRYSSKLADVDSQTATNFGYLDDPTTNFLMGTLQIFRPGVITYKDRSTGQVLAQVKQNFGQTGPSYTVLNSTLPTTVPEKAAIRYAGSVKNYTTLDELMDQFTVTKKIKNGSITGGFFYTSSRIISDPNITAPVLSVSAIGNRTAPLDVSFVQDGTGTAYQISDPNSGYLKLGGSFGGGTYDYNSNQLSLFLGNNLNLTEKLNFDWGIRYETASIKGSNNRAARTTKSGGFDGNPLTIYDNHYSILGTDIINFNKKTNVFAYSAGLNYKFNDKNAVYVRYTDGEKSPDLSFYNNYTSDFIAKNNSPINQRITQFELGYKLKDENFQLTVTPFYSKLSNIGTTALGNDDAGILYYTPVLYNSVRTLGLEFESDLVLTKNFSVKSSLTLQDAKYTSWKTWVLGNQGKGDDIIIDNTGNRAENNPNIMFAITPTYSIDKFYTFIQWKYLGDREVNQNNAYKLPAFSQFDLGMGYDFNAKFSIALNVNNLTDKLGIMSSASPGGIDASLSPQNITKAQVAANPNAVHSILAIQPRAYFLTATYKF
ncbi:TonB-dependent receptor domain-containing protein [Flavobacterium sp. ZT3R25]|uniref:TonB-dependent receptor n=1 Tax=Flavobacterium galactosi TaxID=3398735 RepID=UPI003A85B791